MWVGRASSEMDAARLEFHDEEQIEGYQPAIRPDLDRCKVDGSQYVPVSLEEDTP